MSRRLIAGWFRKDDSIFILIISLFSRIIRVSPYMSSKAAFIASEKVAGRPPCDFINASAESSVSKAHFSLWVITPA